MAYACLFATPLQAQQAYDETPLSVATKNGMVTVRIERAVTPQQRTQGLMFRRQLDDDAGMLFDFETEQRVAMWMKNTYIPLDMVFIRADGTIGRIEENTIPFSLDTIEAGMPVRYVLELAGGAAARLGLKTGDKVSHPSMMQ